MDRTHETSGSLQWLDYLIIALVFLISTLIGVYYRFSGGRQKTAEEYFMAKGSTNAFLLGIALMVSFMSAIAMLGISGEAYSHGGQFALMNVGFALGTPLAAFLYTPVFYNLQYISIFQYLERRFGLTARLVASIATFLQSILCAGVVLYAPAIALEATTGLSSMMSVLVIGLICTFYSAIGGMKAVMASDVFQGILMFISLFATIGVASYDFDGGFDEAWEIAKKAGRTDLNVDFDLDPTVRHTFWGIMIGGSTMYLVVFGVSQTSIQRLLGAKTLASAQIAVFLSTLLTVGMSIVALLAGVMVYAWFEGCDPVASGQVFSFDQALPYFAKVRMSKIPGLSGLFIAGVTSGSLSTISAGLNSLSAVAIADYVQPICRRFGRELPDSTVSVLGKVFSAVIGLVMLAIAYMASRLGSLIHLVISVNGAMGGPILGLFSLGMFFESANEVGAVIGTVLSLAFSSWIVFGQPKPPTPTMPVSIEQCSNTTVINSAMYEARLQAYKDAEDFEYFWLYRVSYLWYTPIGLVTTLLFGYIASKIVTCVTKEPMTEHDPDLFTPILAARMRRRQAAAVKTSQVFILNPQ